MGAFEKVACFGEPATVDWVCFSLSVPPNSVFHFDSSFQSKEEPVVALDRILIAFFEIPLFSTLWAYLGRFDASTTTGKVAIFDDSCFPKDEDASILRQVRQLRRWFGIPSVFGLIPTTFIVVTTGGEARRERLHDLGADIVFDPVTEPPERLKHLIDARSRKLRHLAGMLSYRRLVLSFVVGVLGLILAPLFTEYLKITFLLNDKTPEQSVHSDRTQNK